MWEQGRVLGIVEQLGALICAPTPALRGWKAKGWRGGDGLKEHPAVVGTELPEMQVPQQGPQQRQQQSIPIPGSAVQSGAGA